MTAKNTTIESPHRGDEASVERARIAANYSGYEQALRPEAYPEDR